MGGAVADDTKLTPETTYGALKAIGEQLVNDYTRRGFFDGRTARLPTVIIRPGRPNAAASSWVSSVFREPIAGQPAVVPIDLDVAVPVSGYATVVENLYRLHEVGADRLGADRAINFPAIAVTARQMISAVRTTVTDRELGPITHELDPAVSTIFSGWATALGVRAGAAVGAGSGRFARIDHPRPTFATTAVLRSSLAE